ncbi:restriction endonuclease subunit S [Dendronalium sp. ChiSLP03b]|uniref:restriction endonuclease subunit S n=1 Tax=Dendronalium sp. ChiSLP03b TaxID=3075381 RepID=UPI002AD590BC|nr:restriction endonuclease subunit S [Dendronalium sp. ChiSLP03b]MDZ8205943.1 restriction endonuclease subunit S [Dendronalium sp. ChiSLP03b]
MSELPDGWIMVPLEDLGYWGSGGTPKRTNPRFYVNGTIPWLVIGDLNDGIVTYAQTRITEEGLLNSSARLLPPKTLLVAMYGSIGKLGITGITCATNQAIAFCRTYQEVIELHYLFYALKNSRDALVAKGQGGAQQNISQTILKAHQIPLAPLNEQKRIADKLDVLLTRVDACQERLERIPPILKRFRQAVLTAATSGQLTEDWREQRGIQEVEWETTVLGSIGSVTGGLIKNTKRLAFTLRKPYLRVANIYANRLELDDVAEIGLTQAEFQKTLLLKGDLLIVEGNGSLDQIGRAAIWNEDISDCVHQNHLIRWRSNGNMLPKFALFWLLSPEGRASLVELASTTTGLYNLSISKITSIPVRVPPLDEQHEIVHCVENLFAYADRIEALNQATHAKVERLTSTLLAKALRGELVPQDPNDEPALMLLERIRTERAAQPVKAKRDMTSRKPPMTKMTKESVKEAIRQLPKDKFSFDELRENLTGDYDLLKDILFTLLSEAEPILTQVFDQQERAMRFFRARK